MDGRGNESTAGELIGEGMRGRDMKRLRKDNKREEKQTITDDGWKKLRGKGMKMEMEKIKEVRKK